MSGITSILSSIFEFLPPFAFVVLFTMSAFSATIMRESKVLGSICLTITVTIVVALLGQGSMVGSILVIAVVIPVVIAASVWAFLLIILVPRKFGLGGLAAASLATGIALGGSVWYGQTVPAGSCSETSVDVAVQGATYTVPIEFRAALKGPWSGARYAWEHNYQQGDRDEDRRDLRSVCALTDENTKPIDASVIEVLGDWRTFDQVEATCREISVPTDMCDGYDRALMKILAEVIITNTPDRYAYYQDVGASCTGEPPSKIRCLARIDIENGPSVMARTYHVEAASQDDVTEDLSRLIEYILLSMQSKSGG
ncbi:hypothetical protein [Aliiroseovarius sp. S253]|uniref:hypothetical protein n=1 Tax=Aliiroseovarius sp. S253 TaxID=3415133 RepID=UPI003C7C7499